MSKGVNIPLKIQGLREAREELNKLEKGMKDAEKAGKEVSKESKKRFDELTKSVSKTAAELKEAQAAGQLLGVKFDDLNETIDGTKTEILPLTSQIGEMEDRMYQLAAAGDTSSKEFKALQAETARLRGVIIQTDRSIDLMAGNTGLDTVATGFGQLGQSILSLNFVQVEKDFADLVGSMKGFAAQAVTGFKKMGKAVGTLSKQFIKFGASLLVNPIFLLVAVITAIVVGIVMLLDHLGFLKPILDAIGKAFDMLIAPIKALIQLFKDLTDSLGLTNFAEEELAAERQKRAEENLKNIEKQSKLESEALDRKIALAQAEGKSTFELEQMKQKAIMETAKQRLKETEILYKALEIQDKLTAEKAKEINDLRRESKKQYLDAANQIKINELNNAKEIKDKEAEVLKERADKYKEYQKNRFDTARLIQDLEIQMMEEGEAKELAALDLKYARLIEDTKLNETLLQSEKNQIIANYETLRQQELDKREADKQKKQLEQQEKDAKFLEDSINKQLEAIEGFQEEAYQLSLTDQEREEEALRTKYENQLQLARDYGQSTFEIEAAYAKQKADMEDKYRKEKLAQDQAVEDAKLQLASDGLNAVSQLTELFANKSEKAAKRAFAIQKAISIAQAVMDTYKGANAIFASAAANPQSILFPAQPFIAAGIAITSGLANVAKIASSRFEGGSTGGGGATGAPSFGGGGATSSASSTPSFELFGQPNDDNNVSAPQSQETQQMTVKAVVVESDITSTQNKIEKMQKNAEL